MPLFRRQSEKCRKRQQRQEVLAQQDPEPNFDLSECELQEVPSGVYAICKVLQKEALFLHCNWLSSLNGGGILSDLFLLRVLDLHNNELKCLPDDIGFLERLQILNLENNKLKKLPENIGKLSNLQNLNVKGNHLRELPSGICNLPVLRLLDVSKNEITRLNQRLAYVRTLETLLLDEDKMQYPAKENELNYQPPSFSALEVLPPPRGIRSSQSENCIKALPDEAHIMESLQQYQNFMKQKRVESCVLEQQLANENRLHRELAAAAAANKQSLVDAISQDQVRMDKELNQLSQKKEEERKRFLSVLNNVEKQAEDLLSELADVSEKARKTEALLDEIEKKRMQEDDWFTVTWEELHNLRRREVLDGMKQILSEFEIFEDQRRLMESERESRGERALQLEKVAENGQVESMLYHREIGQRTAMRTLEEQDKLQKQAFQALQMARDAKHSRISNQIVLIEAELAQLTVVEIDRKSMRLETEKNLLAEKRIALTAMLSQLLKEQFLREHELQQRLSEMEEQRENGQADYWLVQYQRLLDRKPQSLIDKESHLEIAVKKLLILAGADDYLPVFARHRITIETFMELGDEDLKKMGVHERGIRKGILKGIKEELAHTSKPKQKEKGITLLPHLSKPKMNETVPPLEPPSACASNSADVPYQMYITARGFNSECVICLDMLSEVIFLPCGHVCSCVICSSPLTQCPMCRTSVDQKVKLTISTPSV
ncbi:E3 ubiquitin-protein ligase LRSAM1-like isoform X2 [Pomacea canaliculata]|uniref:E3 ubiquitin-protein ligase LRSAM1-like isoform X2 n=1 Tax=Pomacea canaliculata TaxID=400727 RepID=UPI000D73E57E|nr:E3 ubiquitin-protein ligase LRSAM1-like isoform X2 [Pomacea canaliculata]